MSQTIKYKILFLSDWHCGSGLSAGADLDILVIKDGDQLPFVPGKTMKGLIRESVEEIQSFAGTEFDLIKIFGSKCNSEGISEQGVCFFTNADLEEETRTTIIDKNLQSFMYRSISQTSINDEGTAEKNSLRKMEVVVPCELRGEILNVPEESVEIMKNGLKFIKRLGQNRNRGLGRCVIDIEEEKQ